MNKTIKLYEEMYGLISKNIKVSKLNLTLDEFVRFMETINYINSLPRLTRRIGDYGMEEYSVANIFRGFIYPDSVTLSCQLDETDFLVRPECNGKFISPLEFISIQNVIIKALRLDNDLSSWQSVKELRPIDGVSLSSIESIAAILDGGNHKCLDGGDPYIPVPLSINLKDKRLYSCPVDDMILRSFLRLILQ